MINLKELDKEFNLLFIRNSYIIYNNKFEISFDEFKLKIKNNFWVKFIDKPWIGYYCVLSNDKEEIFKLSNKINNIEIKFQGIDNTSWFPIDKKNLLDLLM
jgi:hypothetical protein